jgi:hypothetical protein
MAKNVPSLLVVRSVAMSFAVAREKSLGVAAFQRAKGLAVL